MGVPTYPIARQLTELALDSWCHGMRHGSVKMGKALRFKFVGDDAMQSRIGDLRLDQDRLRDPFLASGAP